MMRIESWLYHQTAAPDKPYLNPSAVHRRSRPLRFGNRRQFQGYESRRFGITQLFLPGEKLPATQTPFNAKSRRALSALGLFRH